MLVFFLLFALILSDQTILNKLQSKYLLSQNDFKSTDLLFDSKKPYWYHQKLNHFDPLDKREFRQKYYMNKDYYEDRVYIGGEAPLTSFRVVSGQIMQLAIKHRGLILGLEHRYYGESHPFPELTSDNMKYLSSEQALEDLKNFIVFIKEQFNMTSQSTKWISVGGSYPGNLSAWLRLKFPHLIHAAWASSAPVLPVSDFYQYDEHLSKELPCSEAIRKSTLQLERLLSSNLTSEEIDQIKLKFHPEMPLIKDPVAFMYILADIVAYVVQYDNPGSSLSARLCKEMSYQDSEWERFARFSRHFFEQMKTSPLEMDIAQYNSTEVDQNESTRQWLWQSCTEFGYWQTAPKNKPLRSHWITEEWHNEHICKQLFGLLDPPPTKDTLSQFGGLDILQSSNRIIFTNGEKDPWRTLSVPAAVLPETDLLENRHQLVLNMQSDKMPSILIDGVGHCADLRSTNDIDPPGLHTARDFIFKTLSRWLKE